MFVPAGGGIGGGAAAAAGLLAPATLGGGAAAAAPAAPTAPGGGGAAPSGEPLLLLGFGGGAFLLFEFDALVLALFLFLPKNGMRPRLDRRDCTKKAAQRMTIRRAVVKDVTSQRCIFPL